MENIERSIRLEFIDICKGIGIILVILGHSDLPRIVIDMLYSFHMPLFFVISGYLYKNEDLKIVECIKKKSKSLIYPYIAFNMLYLLLDVLKASADYIPAVLIKKIIAIVYGNYIWENNYEYIGTLWFLLALFCTEIIYAFVRCLYKKYDVHEWIMVLLIGGSGLLYCHLEKLDILPLFRGGEVAMVSRYFDGGNSFLFCRDLFEKV